MDKTNYKKKHLKDKLKRIFSPILLIGNILSITVTIFVLFYNLINFACLKDVIYLFKDINKSEVIPILNQAELLTISTFQNYFNSLYKIENFFEFLESNLNKTYDRRLNLINLVIFKKYKDYFNLLNLSNYYLEFGLWGINNEIEDIAENETILKLDILLLNSVIPLLKSIYTQINSYKNILDRIIIIFNDRELYFEYPFFQDLKFTNFKNKKSCINFENNYDYFPDYMDYHCQNWFIDAYKLFSITNEKYYISPPHELYSNSTLIGVTQCIKGKSIFPFGDIKDKQFILYCFDIIYFDIFEKLTSINTILRGFIFISRIYNYQSFYYPRVLVRNIYNLTSHDEFNENSTFYLDDLNIYLNKSLSMIQMYKKDEMDNYGFLKDDNDTYFFPKNIEWLYKIYPIYFRDGKKTFSLLNIIFIKNKNETEDYLKNMISKHYIIFPSVFFLFDILIMFILTRHLISIIGSNIVLPIKNIKNTLKKMEEENNIFNQNENENNQNSNEKNNIDDSTQLLPKINEKKEKIINSDESDLDEEEFINIRSKDIQDLFCKLINVRDSLDTLYINNNKDSPKNLKNMVFATEIFKQVKNKNALNITNSNIGNLLLNVKKYDLAIMHLLESDFYKDFDDEKNKGLNKIDNDDEIEQYNILIESRYPKLIYNFKKYFSNLKKIEKIKNDKNSYAYNSQNVNKNLINEYELFSTKQKHLLIEYNIILDKYISLTKNKSNLTKTYSNLINAYIEKVEFYIKYYINEENATTQIYSSIHKLFHKIKQYIKINKEFIKPKHLLKSLLNENIENENIEIPNEIFIQRLNYLKGLLSYKSKHYLKAIKYFIKVTSDTNKKVSDAKISIKSIKKLISISSLIYSQYEKINRFNNEKELIKQYISLKNNEINKFQVINKDYIFIISSNTLQNFIESAYEKTRYIIDNYITNEDRFSVTLGCENELKIISILDFKKSFSNNLIFDFIQTYCKNEYFLDNKEDTLKFLIKKSKSYLVKKNIDSKRLGIIIFMGIKNNISVDNFLWLCSKEIEQVINGKNEKLILILQEINNQNNEFIDIKNNFDYSKINKTSCEIINFEDIKLLKNKLKIYGNINENINFPYEKYVNI